MEQYEIINGKPYFGRWYGICRCAPDDAFIGNMTENSIHLWHVEKLKEVRKRMCGNDFEIRNETIVSRPPYYSILQRLGQIGLKFILWGRAFKVARLEKKGVKRYKKKRINGRFKYVRIDNCNNKTLNGML